MEEEVVIIQPLPSTAETENGPIMQSAFNVVTVYYDHERVNNCVGWGRLKFLDALAVRWTPDVACTGGMLKGYSKVASVKNSKWLKSMELQAQNIGMSLGDSSSHYVVYFDHFGCLEVLADSFEFVDEVEPPASIE